MRRSGRFVSTAQRRGALLPPRGRPRPRSRTAERASRAPAKRSSGSFASSVCTTSSKKGESCGFTLADPPRRPRRGCWRSDRRGRPSSRKGCVPGGELVEQHAEARGGRRGRRRRRPPPRNCSGRGVLERAHEEPGLREADRLVLQPRHAEVHHLDHVVRGDEHVLGLQVAVDDARLVDGGEALARSPGRCGGRAPRGRAPARRRRSRRVWPSTYSMTRKCLLLRRPPGGRRSRGSGRRSRARPSCRSPPRAGSA